MLLLQIDLKFVEKQLFSIILLCRYLTFQLLKLVSLKKIPSDHLVVSDWGGNFFVFVRDFWFISLILLGVAGILLYMWFNYHMFGLIIRLNSGDTKLIKSQDSDFLKDVVFVLRNIMDSEEDRSITFNLDQRTIVDNVSGSNVVLGNVGGDVVNRL